MRYLLSFFLSLIFYVSAQAQKTFPVNGVADERQGAYAFTNASIAKDGQVVSGTLLIRDGKITGIGANITVPKDAMVIDCKGKYIYPSFIDAYADYGILIPQRSGNFGFSGGPQINSNVKGAFGWNQAIHSEVDASKLFSADESKAKSLIDLGFGTVLTHQKDGIARGTGAVVTLANQKENFSIVKEKASAHYSFSKGASTQSYPTSMMGSIALLRQTYYDALWYRSNPAKEGTNLSLEAWNNNQSLPQIFEANDKWNALRADRIGDEFGIQYIIKAGGNEYQRINEMKATKASFILPINYPQAMDMEDANDARFVSLADMKHWELAPTNPAAFEKAGINFCITTADLKETKQFSANLKKAIEYGLTESKALESLTKVPAQLLGIYDKVGSLDTGKLANFIITSGPLFADKTTILQNWIQGQKFIVKEEGWSDIKGLYNLTLNGAGGVQNYTLDVKAPNSANVIGQDTVSAKFSYEGRQIRLSFTPTKKSKSSYRLSGFNNEDAWNGYGEDTAGNKLTWTAKFNKATETKADSTKKKEPLALGKVTYPFQPFGWEELPKQENLLIKNATVWTNEKDGVLQATDVLVKNGKIVQIGKNITDASAKQIDGTGKYLTPGIIDEHSHIAAASINEGAQSVTSEVRIGDNLDPDDIDIYRQLSGGVTTSHILHGSANTIGGQTQLIKLRWGANDDSLKFKGADPFIKFALGENVKRSSFSQGNTRFPDTRMGVEQVMVDAFTRAKDYENALKKVSGASKNAKGAATANPYATVRRDLELDALVEIMNKKRFITCHSYVQSEITSTMRIAEKFGFRINTFTHILEGYKVADKMKTHGANASTFSDWWAYKMEVADAIPYNPSIMQKVGLNVAINSDDAEMARRLNQEAAKSVKYGGLSEVDAFNMVTLNPAKMLHIDDKVGSIKVGKDADLVLWTDNPLSVYARAEKTIVDGIIYYDKDRDDQLRKSVIAERNRLIQKMLGEKKGGATVVPPTPSYYLLHNCAEHEHSHGLLAVEAEAEQFENK
jgi:imidazolonepropionase-like amidohydrolase